MICEERVRQEREKSRQINGKNDKHSVLKAKVIGIIPRITRIVKIKEKTDHSRQNNSAPWGTHMLLHFDVLTLHTITTYYYILYWNTTTD